MKLDIALQRCFRHGTREAVARCPQCHRFFCRECITEHEDRVLCSSCLEKALQKEAIESHGFRMFRRILNSAFSLLLLWFFFYLVGKALILLPTSFHDGTLWKTP